MKFWGVAIVVFVLDRVSKLLVVSLLPLGADVNFGLVSFTHMLNTGTLFGLGKSASLFLLLFSLAVVVYIIAKHKEFPKEQIPLGLVLGGAFGNLIDRLYYGAVIDFVDVHFWPVFNVADAAITVAVLVLILRGLKK